VAAQVGILSALATFLFTYQVYKNEYRRRDRVAAIIAATAAVAVALFPTAAPHSSLTPQWGMAACMLWAAIAPFIDINAPIFWQESVAVELFATSWLVKGRAIRTIRAAGTQTLHYGRNPRQLVNTARNAICA
jgi:hypothetical protein